MYVKNSKTTLFEDCDDVFDYGNVLTIAMMTMIPYDVDYESKDVSMMYMMRRMISYNICYR